MKTVSNFLGKCISWVLFLLLSVFIVITFMQVVCRFLLHVPTVWSEEVVRMSFVWLIFLGSAVAIKEWTHLSLDMMTSAMPLRIKAVMQYWVIILILVSSAVILYAGASYCQRSIGKTAVTLPIPANCVYIAVPISAAFMMFFAIELLLNKITGAKKEKG